MWYLDYVKNGGFILKISVIYPKKSHFPFLVDKKNMPKTHFFYPRKPSLATPQKIDFRNFGDKNRHFSLHM